MNEFLIGWAEESITPDKKVMLKGQFYERISEAVETPITATAMAVEQGEEKMILMSVDLVAVMDSLMAAIRKEFEKYGTGVSPDKLIVGATHTHTSIDYVTGNETAGNNPLDTFKDYIPEGAVCEPEIKPSADCMCGQEAVDFIAKRVAKAAKKAWDNRSAAYIANEFGRAAVGHCRRVSYDDGTSQMWGDTNTANFVALEGGNDSGIELLYTFSKDKKLTGIVANIACPAQTLEHQSFISADFWGKAKERLREKLGENIYLLGMAGAAGDQCPRDLVRWVNPDKPIKDPNIKRPNYLEKKADPSMFEIRGCSLIGKRIANEILSVYEDIENITSEAKFEHKVFKYKLPIRKVTITEYENARREIERFIDKNSGRAEFDFEDKAKMFIHVGTCERYAEQQTKETVDTEVHIIRLGDIAISTNPFELFLDYGNRIKARSHAKQTFIMQLACGDMYYLPTEKAEKAGHYSAYVSSGIVGHDGGDILVRNIIDEINCMMKKD